MASENLIVVLDVATARTGTGCIHGIAWYAAKLGSALAGLAADRDSELANALMYGIRFTADQHRDTCDLSHPGTPSAATAMLRLKDTALEYLVLGDVTVLIDTTDGIQVITDDRVDKTARAERDEADRHPFGSAEKQAALLIEAADPSCMKWARNKRSDDATAVYAA